MCSQNYFWSEDRYHEIHFETVFQVLSTKKMQVEEHIDDSSQALRNFSQETH